MAVIGAGSAGEKIARNAARAGMTVALVEEDLVGGECPYYACIPSKALLRPAHILAEARLVPGMSASVDPDETFAWRDDLVHHLDDSAHLSNIDFPEVTLLRGWGRLAGPGRVAVDHGEPFSADAIVVSAGSQAVVPPIPGLGEYVTAHQLTVARNVPPRLLVLGGGVVGSELGQAFAALGSQVTLVDRGPRLIDEEEPEAGQLVESGLKSFGVDTRFGTTIREVRRADHDQEALTTDGRAIGYDELLLAIGQEPRLDDIGLETLGLPPGEVPPLDVDFRAEEGVFFVGDVNGSALYTHAATAQANLVIDILTGRSPRRISPAISGPRAPRVVFTYPAVAAVGVTSAESPPDGRVARFDLGTVPASNVYGRGNEGFAAVVVDADDRLIGATFVSVAAPEMLQAATVAIVNGLTVDQLRAAMSAYPTFSDVWAPLLAQL